MSPELKAKLLDRGPRGGLFFEVGPEVVDRMESLEGVLADIMQYDLRGILPPGLLLRMEELEVVI
ncbi:MAG: hypothetical protein P4L10_11115 [Acidobacteriaceae bacterium]|nr:hypothetical protein [Acidobacteriaceae bacterium]